MEEADGSFSCREGGPEGRLAALTAVEVGRDRFERVPVGTVRVEGFDRPAIFLRGFVSIA